MRKWLISLVFPGVAEVIASFLLPVNILISDDLPTFERPIKANSGSFAEGFWATRVLLPTNLASTIFIKL